MAVDLQIVPTRAIHARRVARLMRASDRNEVAASCGATPFAALALSLRKSSRAWTALVDGKAEVIFGVGDLNILTATGAPWLLGTDAVDVHFRLFLRESRAWRAKLFEDYAALRNIVDARNTTSIRWLKWLGFSLSAPIDVRGQAFHLFEGRRHV